MAITNVFDIYNATLAADKPTVDAIVAAILVQLEESIAANISVFDFDLIPYFVDMEGVKQNRIIDRVIATLRNAGIHVQVKSAPLTVQDPTLDYPYYSQYFNNISTSLNMLTIKWYTRNSQEFMKTYV